MRKTIASLSLEVADLTKVVELRDAEIAGLRAELATCKEIIWQFQQDQENEEREGGLDMNPTYGLQDFLSIDNATNPLWDELVVVKVEKGYNCYFPKEFYDTNKKDCHAFLGKIMRHSHGMKKKAWFAPDYLAIRNG